MIDGESGDLRKRGYVVPAYGEVRIEGFRTSTSDVATFRFSSVTDSYAGQKGKARNVGVIAAAIFEESAPVEQQIITADKPPAPTGRPYDYRDDVVGSRDGVRGGGPKDYKKAPAEAERPRSEERPSSPVASRPAPPAPRGGGAARAPRHIDADYGGDEDYVEPTMSPPADKQVGRPGLGTEYGEQRTSAATYTRFTRNNNTPIAIAELRYNDASGLTALGIPVAPLPDSGEIMTRETADPFPGDDRFARPPARR
ncbi:MAG: hypothetical protein NT062_35280 [Proteobacteria bacterium]|nr:hypothetical protein [Pseudomonadota bacterium]